MRSLLQSTGIDICDTIDICAKLYRLCMYMIENKKICLKTNKTVFRDTATCDCIVTDAIITRARVVSLRERAYAN